MTIAQTMFWIDRDSRSIGIRSSNRKTGTQPFEGYLNRSPGLLNLNFYESSDEGGRELRLSFRLLWISINMLICMLEPRENSHRFDDRNKEWGWYFLDRCFSAHWGFHRVSWGLPFITTVHVRSEILSLSRNRVVYTEPKKGAFELDEYAKREAKQSENSATFDYQYELDNGEKQNVKATIYVERIHWRRKWLPLRISATDHICVTFSEEVGPERGSWKGGCTGCGYTIKGKETARQCLRRMEQVRRFNR